jgi:hypothetical protein
MLNIKYVSCFLSFPVFAPINICLDVHAEMDLELHAK